MTSEAPPTNKTLGPVTILDALLAMALGGNIPNPRTGPSVTGPGFTYGVDGLYASPSAPCDCPGCAGPEEAPDPGTEGEDEDFQFAAEEGEALVDEETAAYNKGYLDGYEKAQEENAEEYAVGYHDALYNEWQLFESR